MTGLGIVSRKQKLKGGDGGKHMTAGLEQGVHLSQRGDVILDMLQHIEHAGGGDAGGAKGAIVQRSADDRIDSAAARGQSPLLSRFDENAGKPRGKQAFGDKAIAATNIEKRSVRRKAACQHGNAPVSMSKPKRAVFNLQACGIAVHRVGNGSLAVYGAPNSVVARMDALRQGRHINRGVSAL